MFDKLLKSLLAPAPQPLDDHDARLALTALLVRIARSDGDYAAAEVARIDAIAAARYALRAIKEAVAYEDRSAVVEAAWQVVLADGARADEEAALMRLVANLLGVNDRDSAIARQKAANRPG